MDNPTTPSNPSTLLVAQEKRFCLSNFKLSTGDVLAKLEIAYLTLGALDANSSNAILLTHGYTSSHRLSKAKNAEASEGGWDLLVGAGKPIDTAQYFVISSNMLGSSYGSTGPASIDPKTGKPYGRNFPKISFSDIVAAQHALLDHLGVKHVHAIVGASYGGLQAFQWAEDFPDRVSGIVAAMSSLWAPEDGQTVETLRKYFEKSPNWHDGDFYSHGDMVKEMVDLRVEMLREYGAEAGLAAQGVKIQDMPAALRTMAIPWAKQFDPHSLLVLLNAAHNLRLAERVSNIKAKVLYLLSSTDRLFPPTLESPVMARLCEVGVDASFRLLVSDRGHRASHEDAQKWAPDLRDFLTSLNPHHQPRR